MRPRLSRLVGGLRVGKDFFERRGLLDSSTTSPKPRGLADKMSDLSHPNVDVTRIHPSVVVFFEDPGSLDLLVRSHWHFPFWLIWWFARLVNRVVGQFVLPMYEARIRTRVFGIDTKRDGRDDARGVIREYAESGDVMQVVAYATWRNEDTGARYMNATFPLPLGSVTGILRVDALGEDADGRTGVSLTSRSVNHDDASVWLTIGRNALAFRVPFAEQIDMWTPSMPQIPEEIDKTAWPGATVIGRHQQRVLGIRFATHHYWFRPSRSDQISA